MKRFLTCLFFVLIGGFSVLCLAQGLPKLKPASEVTMGTLPNGINYYIVNNPALKGTADFALIQGGQWDEEESRKVLIETPHIRISDFMRRAYVPYTPNGFVSYSEEARIFHFPDVDVASAPVRDSALLALTDLMTFSPWDQTVIISGDIDAKSCLNDLETLSLMVPRVGPPPRPEAAESAEDEGKSSLGTPVRFKVKRVRVAREQAGTPVPLVSELLERELGFIIKDRLAQGFSIQEIPFCIETKPTEILVYTPDSLQAETLYVVESVLSDIVAGRVTGQEFLRAKNISLEGLIKTGLEPGKTNDFYIDRCIRAALDGANLASQKTIRDFFAHRKISVKRELELFNNFASAFISEQFPAIDPGGNGPAGQYPILGEVLKTKTGKSVKLVGSTTDPVTGGVLMTFANNAKVIFKNDPSAEGFAFCLSLKGGASSVPDIACGEGAFLADMLGNSTIAGMKARDFIQMLCASGINIAGGVGLEDLRIYGTAPSESLDDVLKALLKIAYDRVLDYNEFEYYKKCSLVREARVLPSIYDVMDSLTCPDYAFLAKSSVANITDELPYKAERYFEQRFDNIADGVFVFVGNLTQEELVSSLSKYFSCFRTSKVYALREKVRYNLHSGRSTYIVAGEDKSVNMAATAMISATGANYYAFLVAQEAVKDYFADVLAPLGMYAEVSGKMEFAPVERMSLYLRCRPCATSGLPWGVVSVRPLAALREVRAGFNELAYFEISPKRLDYYKEIVKNNVAYALSTPEGLVEFSLMRYVYGKDLTADYKAKVDALVADDILWVLENLTESGVVEYIVD